MKVKAYAKINLALDVVKKRADGYHELEMIMAPLTLHDLIYINVIEEGIEIDSNSVIMPRDQRNIMYRVAELMFQKYKIKKGIKIYIYKHIPTQAGLAGGSADGAAVIKAINILFKLNLSVTEMAELGKTIGADIPFCIYNRVSLVKGIGEKITFAKEPLAVKVLLVKPKKGVSTKKAFRMLDLDQVKHLDCDQMYQGINERDYQKVIDNLQNTLEQPAVKLVPEIAEIKRKMLELGFDGALMSGSGSCVFGLTRDKRILDAGYNYFRGNYRFVRKTEIYNGG